MYLCDGKIDNNYKVTDIELPTNIGKRLEALGMGKSKRLSYKSGYYDFCCVYCYVDTLELWTTWLHNGNG